jgi:hypothetical protein
MTPTGSTRAFTSASWFGAEAGNVKTSVGVETAAVRAAAEAERLSWTDPQLAAQHLTQLAELIRELRRKHPGATLGSTSLEHFDGYADELAVRLVAGRLCGIAGLERRTRQYVAAFASEEDLDQVSR